MKKQNKKMPFILVSVLCMVLAAGGGFLVMRTLRLREETQHLDEQFAKELEESRKTIDKLKEQETELEKDLSQESEEKQDADAAKEQESEETDEAVPSLTPTPGPVFVSIMDCLPGEILPAERLYMENPGIYFTAAQIAEGDDIYRRFSDRLSQENGENPLERLRYLKMPYYDDQGEIRVGEMVVNAEISQEVLDAFLELFQKKQEISSLNLEENIWMKPDDWSALKNKFHLTYEKTEEESKQTEATGTKETTGTSESAETAEASENTKGSEASDAVFVEE
ncbi:MAG: hypothetical protein Q4C77_02315 [Eubacteriales bacterium]|nr:hypothetical protein [Eubacteriales bacterium]